MKHICIYNSQINIQENLCTFRVPRDQHLIFVNKTIDVVNEKL